MNGTKTINQSVKRNIDRFLKDFHFQLTSLNEYDGVRKNPYVFTEQGVAMLASVLKTSTATKVSISIMRTFVMMRKYISNELIEKIY